ncbi:predicted metal-dependent phosphoesterase [Longilinea arvoryzae]|uniref:Predicted metal-dependent phosphoesterase n=1 Tax=Longilinea arvoryzae TaxID=360412 RepID=A0A0S7BKM6_9CHLR|nr:PHP domain-containing protein [Longilinea arvoryzae]GAP15664.1 predicted metal-dependent phosphoesterase [Longilinea arvoryzae]
MKKISSGLIFCLLAALLTGCASPTPDLAATVQKAVIETYVALTFAPTATVLATPTPFATPGSTITPTETATDTGVPTETLFPTETLIPIDTLTPQPGATRTLGPLDGTVWQIDLHMHTTCSDGDNTYEEMVQGALDLGLDLIAITDHIVCPDVTQACLNETRLVCIPGQEVSSDQHIVGLGVTQYISPGQPYADIVTAIHNQGGLAIAAHPYTRPWVFDEATLYGIGFDAMECWMSNAEDNQHQIELGAQNNIACTYDSDAHEVLDLGTRYMDCSVPIYNLSDLNSALHSNLCAPRQQ